MKQSDSAQCKSCNEWMIVSAEERLLVKIFRNGPYCKRCQDEWSEDEE